MLPFSKKLELFQQGLKNEPKFQKFRFIEQGKSHSLFDLIWESLYHDLKKEYPSRQRKKEKNWQKKRYWSCDAEYFPRLTAFMNVNVEQEGLVHAYSLLVRISKASPASKEDNWVPFLLSSFIISLLILWKAKLPGFFYKKQTVQKQNFERAKAKFQGKVNNSAAGDRAKNRVQEHSTI